MSENERVERWLRKTAQSAALQELQARLKSAPALPRDILARYQAGLLSPEEEEMVAQEIALNPKNLDILAEFEQDLHAAGDEMPVASQGALEKVGGALSAWIASITSLSVAE